MQNYLKGIFFFLFITQFVYGQGLEIEFPAAEKVILANSRLDNMYRIDEGVYRSEQPGKKDFKALEELGIREVLNLRRLNSDDREAKGTSIKLHRLKMNAFSIKQEQLIEALRIIKNRQGPILIHCKHGSDRAGSVIAMYRIIFQNIPVEDAITEMVEGGFGFHKICRNIPPTIRKADIEAIRKALAD